MSPQAKYYYAIYYNCPLFLYAIVDYFFFYWPEKELFNSEWGKSSRWHPHFHVHPCYNLLEISCLSEDVFVSRNVLTGLQIQSHLLPYKVEAIFITPLCLCRVDGINLLRFSFSYLFFHIHSSKIVIEYGSKSLIVSFGIQSSLYGCHGYAIDLFLNRIGTSVSNIRTYFKQNNKKTTHSKSNWFTLVQHCKHEQCCFQIEDQCS